MNSFTHVPPGFRFHPTDEELVDHYLRKKICSKRIDVDVIKDVDLYRIEPWDLQGTEEQNEWYFFSHKDKKYPTGTRTNRATKAGFWKATGRDKAIYLKHSLIGMRKTLVFYKGRAPNGQKSDWIMHEYRLETNENATPQEEGWVVCRVFKKRLATMRKDGDHESICWYDDQVSFMQDFESPRRMPHQPYPSPYSNPHYSCKQELDHLQYNHVPHDHGFLQLPQLESPRVSQSNPNLSCNILVPYAFERMQSSSLTQEEHLQQSHQQHISHLYSNQTDNQAAVEQVTDWRVLDKFVASQLSHEDADKQTTYSDATPSSLHEVTDEHISMMVNEQSKRQQEIMGSDELASIATSSSQVDLWK